jgi:hypothetical protein
MKSKSGVIFGMAYVYKDRERSGYVKPKLGVRYEGITFLGKMLRFNLGFCTLALYSHEMKTPKQVYRCWRYDLTRWLQITKKRFINWYKYNFDKKPIYYYVSSMDCDCCESTWFGKKDSYKEYQKWLNDEGEWDWVEGNTSVNIISKEEYLENKDVRTCRDYIMEAFEDGRGSNVVI